MYWHRVRFILPLHWWWKLIRTPRPASRIRQRFPVEVMSTQAIIRQMILHRSTWRRKQFLRWLNGGWLYSLFYQVTHRSITWEELKDQSRWCDLISIILELRRLIRCRILTLLDTGPALMATDSSWSWTGIPHNLDGKKNVTSSRDWRYSGQENHFGVRWLS